MTEDNSPYFRMGVEDGERDAELVSRGREPVGPDPERVWSLMYMRGYDRAGPAIPVN